ncbi:hypothetical protein BS47DRAFT_1322196 [Hydnum rufescens UP504]|uniref:DUF7598 domain-containing protein n=1 Tax=Hydnum rufescens UP504 TaxID=1448309 RepID=A0A9P6AHE3_9AGAM|nr:hypothetical protein BS47DRAFT_1322196 [Hydnum rufescens UP504]
MLPPRAYLFFGLNIARGLSLLTLILVFASTSVYISRACVHYVTHISVASWPPSLASNAANTVVINGTEYFVDCDYLGNSTVPLQPGGSMFAIINQLFIIFQVLLLFFSEISWPSSFFDNFIPVFGSSHGVGILGFMQIFIGAAVLSHHVGTFALVSAFFLFAIGCMNVLLGLTYRASIKTKRSLTSWRDRVPELPRSASDFHSNAKSAAGVFGVGGSVFTNVSSNEKEQLPTGSAHSGYGFGRQGEKHAGLKGFLISKPVETLPRYVPKPSASRSSSRVSDDSESSIPIQDPPRPNRI